MTIKAIKVFDWTQQRVLAWIQENGQDRIEWIPMELVYVNERANARHNRPSEAKVRVDGVVMQTNLTEEK